MHTSPSVTFTFRMDPKLTRWQSRINNWRGLESCRPAKVRNVSRLGSHQKSTFSIPYFSGDASLTFELIDRKRFGFNTNFHLDLPGGPCESIARRYTASRAV